MHFPAVSLARAMSGGGAARRREAAVLAQACQATGFFFLTDHGVPARVWDGLFPAARNLFDLPSEAKAEVHFSRQRVWPGEVGGFPTRGYVRPDEERLGPLPSNHLCAVQARGLHQIPAGRGAARAARRGGGVSEAREREREGRQ